MGSGGEGAVVREPEPEPEPEAVDSTEIDDFLFKAVATEGEIAPILQSEKDSAIFGDSSGSDSFDEEAALKERERKEARKKKKSGKKRTRSSRSERRSGSLHGDLSSSESSDGDQDDDEDWVVEKKPKKDESNERERPKGRTQKKKAASAIVPPKKVKRLGGDPWAAAIFSSRAREGPHYAERPAYPQIGQQQQQQQPQQQAHSWRRQASHEQGAQGRPSWAGPPQAGPPRAIDQHAYQAHHPPHHSQVHQQPPHLQQQPQQQQYQAQQYQAQQQQAQPQYGGQRGEVRGYEETRGGPPGPYGSAGGPPPSSAGGTEHMRRQAAPATKVPSNPALAATLKELTESAKTSTSKLTAPIALHPDLEEARKSFKKYSSKIIVANVTKYNKEEAVGKDAFKSVCRKLTHVVMEKEKKNSFVITHKTEAMLCKLVDSHMKSKFPKHKRVLRKAKR